MAFGGFLKQNTAVDVLIGPFLDNTDGDTPEIALVITQADVLLSKNGQALSQKNDANNATHDTSGYYICPLNATDTNTLGILTLEVHIAGALYIKHEYEVVTDDFYEWMCETGTGVASAPRLGD